jgi:hypothetical protein
LDKNFRRSGNHRRDADNFHIGDQLFVLRDGRRLGKNREFIFFDRLVRPIFRFVPAVVSDIVETRAFFFDPLLISFLVLVGVDIVLVYAMKKVS